MKYRLYRNLHKGCFSVQQYTKGVGYRVIAHISHGYILNNCTYKVYSSGRDKVLKHKQKNVHAYIQFDSYNTGVQPVTDEQPYYNPYQVDSFVSSKTFQPITASQQLQLINNQIFIL